MFGNNLVLISLRILLEQSNIILFICGVDRILKIIKSGIAK